MHGYVERKAPHRSAAHVTPPPSDVTKGLSRERVDFQSLSSLEAYVLVAQDARRVDVYRRNDGGDWQARPDVYTRGESFSLPGLTDGVAVDDILDGDGGSLLP